MVGDSGEALEIDEKTHKNKGKICRKMKKNKHCWTHIDDLENGCDESEQKETNLGWV